MAENEVGVYRVGKVEGASSLWPAAGMPLPHWGQGLNSRKLACISGRMEVEMKKPMGGGAGGRRSEDRDQKADFFVNFCVFGG